MIATSAATLCGGLLWQSLQGGGVPGCAPGSGCDAVLSSPWSKVLGVPIAAPALVVYISALAASLHIGARAPEPRRRGAWVVLVAASYAAAMAAVWFTLVQLVSLGVLCKWCTAVHAHGVMLAILVFIACPFRGRPSVVAAGSAAVGVVAMIVLQLAMPSPTVRVDRTPAGYAPITSLASGRSFAGGSVRLDPARYPLLGTPDAPVIIVELFDYTCPGCRRLHEYLDAARHRYGEALAIVALPVPLDPQCNPMVTQPNPLHETACELATIALAVWQVSPEAFGELHDWMLDGEVPPTPEAALERAQSLIGVEPLGQALLDPAVPDLLDRTIRLYQVTDFRGGSLPRLLTENTIISGRPPTVEAFFGVLEEETALESPDPGAGTMGTEVPMP